MPDPDPTPVGGKRAGRATEVPVQDQGKLKDSALPPDPAPPRRKRRRVIRVGTETDHGFRLDGQSSPSAATVSDDSNDARLIRDVPPHW